VLNTVLGALLPMVVTFVLGFIAAWHRDLGRNDASILSDGSPLCSAARTFCRSRYDIARGTEPGHSAWLSHCASPLLPSTVWCFSSLVSSSASQRASARCTRWRHPRQQCLSWVPPSSVACSEDSAPFRSQQPVSLSISQSCQSRFFFSHWMRLGERAWLRRTRSTWRRSQPNLPKQSNSRLLSVALIDGDVTPAQFKPDRIVKPDVQAWLKKVSTHPNGEFTAQYPRKMPAKITIRLQDRTVVEHQVQDYPGLASRPFT
jgi:hypothetical protein